MPEPKVVLDLSVANMLLEYAAAFAPNPISDEHVERLDRARAAIARAAEGEETVRRIVSERDRLRGGNRHIRYVEAAARKVPIVDVDPEPDGVRPWLTCKGCGSTDSEGCESGCWVRNLDVALGSMNDYAALAEGERDE